MTILFSDGFESGDFSAWTNTAISGATTSFEVVNNGHHGLYKTNAKTTTNYPNGAYATKNIAPSPIIYARAYFKINTLTIQDGEHLGLIFIGDTWDKSCRIQIINIAGTLRWQMAVFDTWKFELNNTATVPIGEWMCVELLRDVTNNEQKVWVNDVLTISTTEVMTTNSTQVQIGMYEVTGVSLNCDLDTDCCVVSELPIGCEPPRTLFRDGFESGDFSAWDVTGFSAFCTTDISNEYPHHGNYHQLSNVVGNANFEVAYNRKNFADMDKVNVRFYIYHKNHTLLKAGDRVDLFRITDSLNNVLVQIIFAYYGAPYNSSLLQLQGRNGAGFAGTLDTSVIDTGKYYCYEVEWYKHATNGYFKLYIDGNLTVYRTGMDTTGFGSAASAMFGPVYKSSSALPWCMWEGYYDCCVVSEDYIGTEVTNRLLTGVGLGCVSSP